MVTIHNKGSDNVRLRSGSCHVMTKKTSIWVPMCKEKRMKNSGESDFRHTVLQQIQPIKIKDLQEISSIINYKKLINPATLHLN